MLVFRGETIRVQLVRNIFQVLGVLSQVHLLHAENVRYGISHKIYKLFHPHIKSSHFPAMTYVHVSYTSRLAALQLNDVTQHVPITQLLLLNQIGVSLSQVQSVVTVRPTTSHHMVYTVLTSGRINPPSHL